MRHRTSLPVRAAVAGLMVLAVTALAPPRATEAARRGEPELRATDMDGRLWRTSELRGRVVLIDFWATWCAPCLAELPRLKRLWTAYPREDLEILGVMLEPGDRRSLVSWLNRHRIAWPQIQERSYEGAVASAFGVRQLPATFLIGSDGRIAAVGLRGEELEARIAELVASSRLPRAHGESRP